MVRHAAIDIASKFLRRSGSGLFTWLSFVCGADLLSEITQQVDCARVRNEYSECLKQLVAMTALMVGSVGWKETPSFWAVGRFYDN
jgi:hypothetical protein